MTDTQAQSNDLELEQQVCFGLSIAARGVVATYRPLLEPLGLTHPQYLVMVALWQHGTQPVNKLGALLVLDSGTLSPLLKRLQGMGYVRRDRAPTDERQVLISLTPQGEQLRADAASVHAGVVRRLAMTSQELDHLQHVLEHVIQTTSRNTPGH